MAFYEIKLSFYIKKLKKSENERGLLLFSYFRITFYAMNSIPDKGVSKTFVLCAVFLDFGGDLLF
jgi:hypothetical protein